MRFRKIFSLFFVLLFIAMPVLAFIERENIFDWYRLRGYTISDSAAQIATDTTMVPSMRHLFYVYHPDLEDKLTFNKHCRSDEQTIVLGCYVDRQGIYLLNVTDSRLNGVEQVTAAHETLHAVYARLNTNERRKVDIMTAKALAGITDQRVKDNIELYRKQDSRIVPNELHSILGTEVRSLPAELEDYYKKYFTERSKVVGYSEQYEQAFTDLKDQVKAYDEELTSLKARIEALQASLTAQSTALQTQRSNMDNLKSSGQLAAYNDAVPGYNASVNRYNIDIDKLSGLVETYNEIVPKRNAIANEESDLAKAIDSRSTVPARQ